MTTPTKTAPPDKAAPKDAAKLPSAVAVRVPVRVAKLLGSLADRALAVEVGDDDASKALAIELGGHLKRQVDLVNGIFKPIRDAAHKLHRMVCTQNDELVGRPKQAIDHLRKQLEGRAARERRAAEIEAKQKAAEERRLLEEHNARLAEAAEAAGDVAVAEEIRTAPVEVPPIAVERPKLGAGASASVKLDFDVVHPERIPRQYLAVDEKAIREAVQRFGKTAQDMIPGIRVFERDRVAFRG